MAQNGIGRVLRGAARSLWDAMSSGRSSGATAADRRLPRPSEDRPSTPVTGTTTVEVEPAQMRDVILSYTPSHDGNPDAGEVVWTWVPYEENDGRGKDRPVLVIARVDATRVYAVRLTSKSHDGERDYFELGSGPWDPAGRPSWVDLEHLYVVHRDGMRREASALDVDRFSRVALALQRRYGWEVGS